MPDLYKSKAWLYKQYKDGKTPTQIAAMCGCNELTIRRWLLKHGIRKTL